MTQTRILVRSSSVREPDACASSRSPRTWPGLGLPRAAVRPSARPARCVGRRNRRVRAVGPGALGQLPRLTGGEGTTACSRARSDFQRPRASGAPAGYCVVVFPARTRPLNRLTYQSLRGRLMWRVGPSRTAEHEGLTIRPRASLHRPVGGKPCVPLQGCLGSTCVLCLCLLDGEIPCSVAPSSGARPECGLFLHRPGSPRPGHRGRVAICVGFGVPSPASQAVAENDVLCSLSAPLDVGLLASSRATSRMCMLGIDGCDCTIRTTGTPELSHLHRPI